MSEVSFLSHGQRDWYLEFVNKLLVFVSNNKKGKKKLLLGEHASRGVIFEVYERLMAADSRNETSESEWKKGKKLSFTQPDNKLYHILRSAGGDMVREKK